MKKMLINRVTGLLLAAVLIIGSAGCSRGQNTGTSQSTPSASLPAPSGSSVDPEDLSGTMTIWYWDEPGFRIMWDEFTKVYKNAKLEYVSVNSQDYLKKIQTSIAAGTELPDLLLGEMAIRGKMLSFDIWENLDAAPYNIDRSKLMDFVVPLGSNEKGQLVGIDNLMCPAGLAYKAELAKQYLGTDDPVELQKMMPDWDAFIEKGKEVLKKSGGTVYMFSSLMDATSVVLGQQPDPIIEGNKAVNLNKVYGKAFEVGAAMRDAGIVDKLTTWSPAWNASFAQDNHIFYPCASWGPQFVIQPNDKDSMGRWRLMIPPEGGFYSGGTIWGVYNKSEVKEITWGYINWSIFGEGADVYREKLGYFVPRKDMYAEGKYDYSKDADPYFGGQNINELLFKTIAPTLTVRPVTQYDQQIGDVSNLIISAIEKDANFTAKQAYSTFIDELKNKIPELEIAE